MKFSIDSAQRPGHKNALSVQLFFFFQQNLGHFHLKAVFEILGTPLNLCHFSFTDQ